MCQVTQHPGDKDHCCDRAPEAKCARLPKGARNIQPDALAAAGASAGAAGAAAGAGAGAVAAAVSVLTSVMIASLSLSALSLCAASMGRRSMLATVSPAGHTHSGTTGIHGVSMPMVTHSCIF
jgi:hypothetical protein